MQGIPAAKRSAAHRCSSTEATRQALGQASQSMQQGQFADAITTLLPYAQALCDQRANLLLAAAYEGSGDAAASLQTLEQAHAHWPADNSVSASLARAYMAQKKLDEAAAALAHFHADASTPQQEMELAGLVLLTAHQLPAAGRVAAQDYQEYPSVKSLLLLANTLQLQGKYKQVIAMLGALRSIYGSWPAFLITLAESEYDALQYDTARADLEAAIALDNSSYQGHFLLGNVLLKLGDADKAIAAYRTAIELAPGQPRSYYQLALALETKDDAARAEQALLQGIAVDAHYAPAQVELGKLLLARDNAAEAVTHLNLALADNPQLEQAYFLLAKAYAETGDQDKSKLMAKKLEAVRTANHQSVANRPDGSGGINPSGPGPSR